MIRSFFDRIILYIFNGLNNMVHRADQREYKKMWDAVAEKDRKRWAEQGHEEYAEK